MRRRILTLLLSVIATVGYAALPDPKTLPQPPSVAINPAPLAKNELLAMTVDTIPPDAKYVVYAELKLTGLTIDQTNVASVGEQLSHILTQIENLAKERGGNLAVILSNEHGIDIRLQQCAEPLRLRAVNPVVTVILFATKSGFVQTPGRTRPRFTTKVPDGKYASVHYVISLKMDTAGVTKAYWTYGNIARFVSDAMKYGMDTIAIRSTTDEHYEEVNLPGCDEPVRISTTDPKLDVTIFSAEKSKQPFPLPKATPAHPPKAEPASRIHS